MAYSPSPAPIRYSVQVEGKSGMLRRALLVEDEELIRVFVAEVLADAGWHVTEAGSGDAAVALLRRESFDLLVTDVHMPGRADGYEVVRQARVQSANLPVVMTTGRPEPGRPALGGAAAMVLKPFRIDAMLSAIAHVAAFA